MASPISVGTIGWSVPHVLIDAAGLEPIRLSIDVDHAVAAAERFGGLGLAPPEAAHLAVLVDGDCAADAVVIGTDTESSAKLFAAVRELSRRDELGFAGPVTCLDLVHLPRPSSVAYNRRRMEQLVSVLAEWSGRRASDADLARAIDRHEQRRAGRGIERRRRCAAADPGTAIFLAGSTQHARRAWQLLESQGWVVVGDDQDLGDRDIGLAIDRAGDPLDAIAGAYHSAPPAPARRSVADRVDYVVSALAETGATTLLYLVADHDEAAPWDLRALRQALDPSGVRIVVGSDDVALTRSVVWLEELAA